MRLDHVLALSLLVWALLASCAPPSGPLAPSADAPEATGWRAETVVSGLENPWSIAWLPDGSLLMSVGDGGNPPISIRGDHIRKQAQNPGADLGKILRLRDDGRSYPDNPLAARPGARPEVWTLGHRNIQGLARDPDSGWVWATEHASQGGDELNLILGGNNYGWPVVSYSLEYWGPRVAEEATRPGMADPRLVWTPSIAPSGLAYYTGVAFPAWRGDLLAGSLKFG